MVLASFLWVVNLHLLHHGKLLWEGTLVMVTVSPQSLRQQLSSTALEPRLTLTFCRNLSCYTGRSRSVITASSSSTSVLGIYQSPSQHCTVPLVGWEVFS